MKYAEDPFPRRYFDIKLVADSAYSRINITKPLSKFNI